MLSALFPMDPALAFAGLCVAAAACIGLVLRAVRQAHPIAYGLSCAALGAVGLLMVPVVAQVLA